MSFVIFYKTSGNDKGYVMNINMELEEENETLITSIMERLPRIDGVDWRVNMYRDYGVQGAVLKTVLSAEITTIKGEDLDSVINKVHQIISFGQVKLELEGEK